LLLRYHKGSNYFEKTNKIEDKCGDCPTAEVADIEALRAIYNIGKQKQRRVPTVGTLL
jgi:hypothetical protein